MFFSENNAWRANRRNLVSLGKGGIAINAPVAE
jgi:hypothetical protein